MGTASTPVALVAGLSTDPAYIGPVRFDPITQSEALSAIEALVAGRRGGYLVTPNVDHVVLAHRDAELGEAYHRASVSVADGQPILWMARLLGRPLPEKVSGSDLIGPLMALAARQGWRVFLLGASPAVSAKATLRLRAQHPGLQIVGRDTSSWDPTRETSSPLSVGHIKTARADLVVVALGCPKQELWMARYSAAIRPAVAIGLGGSLDFVAGAMRRSPRWMSRMGLEWLFRLAQEPRRLAGRYLVRGPEIIPAFFGALRQRRLDADQRLPAGAADPFMGSAHVSA